jgi:hypothetical protein
MLSLGSNEIITCRCCVARVWVFAEAPEPETMIYGTINLQVVTEARAPMEELGEKRKRSWIVSSEIKVLDYILNFIII